MSKRRHSRLAVKKERLRILTLDETEHARGGEPPYTHFCHAAGGHPNCPSDSRYCN